MGKIKKLFEREKLVLGVVVKNNAPKLNLALIKSANIKELIGVTANSKLVGVKVLKDLKVNQKVKVMVKDTVQGPFAVEVRII